MHWYSTPLTLCLKPGNEPMTRPSDWIRVVRCDSVPGIAVPMKMSHYILEILFRPKQ